MPMTRMLLRLAAICLAFPLALAVQPAEASSSSLKKAQRQLSTLGCTPGKATGKLTTRTQAALQKFQSAADLPMSGKLTSKTRAALAADNPPRCDVRPVPTKSGKGRRVVISQRQNWMWLVRDDGSVVAQGGIIDNPRVVKAGTFWTGSKCGRPGRIKLNQDYSLSLWLDNFVRFGSCGEGVHRIPRYKSSGKQMHADWYLGSDLKTSHGCIRVSNAMSKRIWSFTKSRTKVVVVRG